MEVTCEHCRVKLNIPDEKIPKDQKARVQCPKCKKKIIVDKRDVESNEILIAEPEAYDDSGGFPLPVVAAHNAAGPKKGDYGYREYSEDKDLDFFEEDSKLTLVMTGNKEHETKIKSAVQSLGYRYIAADSTRDAIGKMRFHHFDLIILEDGFDGSELRHSPVISHLNRFSMSIRRKIFLAVISYDFKTMDNMMAFALSANLVINPKEMDRFAAILKKAISDNEKFYKVFSDTMTQLGKA